MRAVFDDPEPIRLLGFFLTRQSGLLLVVLVLVVVLVLLAGAGAAAAAAAACCRCTLWRSTASSRARCAQRSKGMTCLRTTRGPQQAWL